MSVNSIRRPVTAVTPEPPVSVTLRVGAKGASVRELQQLLCSKGYNLSVDGDFGLKTKAAVMAFQGKYGLEPDGIVGPKTWAALRGGTSKPNAGQGTGDTFVGNNKPQTSTTTTPSTTTPSVSVDQLAAAANAKKLEQAKALVKAGGTGTQADADAVARAMTSLPSGVLEAAKGKVDVIACRGSVTDYMTDLKGVRPRGWPPGSTWDIVPGLYNPSTNETVVATLGNATNRRVPAKGEGHGSADVVFHELAHGLDDADVLGDGKGRTSHDDAFRKAYEQDRKLMEANHETYLLQEGDAGLQEAFAETFARFFRRDPTMKAEMPGMYAYWQKVEAAMK